MVLISFDEKTSSSFVFDIKKIDNIKMLLFKSTLEGK